MNTNRKVVVNDVTVDFFDDVEPQEGTRSFPIRATLSFLRSQTVMPQNPEALDRLTDAGVEHVPLYRSEAEANGVEWAEVDA